MNRVEGCAPLTHWSSDNAACAGTSGQWPECETCKRYAAHLFVMGTDRNRQAYTQPNRRDNETQCGSHWENEQ